MQEINLLQTKIKDRNAAWERRNRLGITVLSLILVALLVATGMFYMLIQSNNTKASEIQQENTALRTALDARKNDVTAATSFQAQLINIRTILGSHIYWTVFLDELSKHTYNKAQFTNLKADVNGKIHAEGMVSSYTDLGKLMLSLNKSDNLSGVKLLSVRPSSKEKSGYVFSLDLTVSREMFKKD